ADTSERERPGVFKKEVPLLGKEEIEPCQVHLLLIDFHLREISAVGRVKGQRGRQAVLEIESPVDILRRPQRTTDPALRAAADEERLDLEVAPRVNVLETLERPRERGTRAL